MNTSARSTLRAARARVALPTALVAVALAGCGGGGITPVGDAPFDSTQTVAASATNPDVAIADCGPASAEGWMPVKLRFTNSARFAQHYHVTIGFFTLDGVQADTADTYGVAYNVAPGTTVIRSTGQNQDTPLNYSCKIMAVETIAADKAAYDSVWWP